MSVKLYLLGRLCIGSGLYVEAYLACHRAIESYLISYAFPEGIVVEDRHGICMANGERVYLLGLFRKIVDSCDFYIDRHLIDFVRNLNMQRNKNILVHGYYGVSKRTAEEVFDKVNELINVFDENKKWERRVREVISLVDIDVGELLGSDASLKSYLSEAVY